MLTRARNLFLQDYPFETIFFFTGLPYKIYFRKQNSWQKLKESLDEEILKEIRNEAISDKAEEFVFRGLDLGLKYLERVTKQGYTIDARDFKLIMDSVMAIHRVKQLETGNPTDISKAYDAMTPEDVKKHLLELKEEILKEHGEMLNYTDLSPEEALDQITNKDGEH